MNAAQIPGTRRATALLPAFTVLSSTAEKAVTWTEPLPSSSYSVICNVVPTAPALLGKLFASVKPGSETTTGCTIQISSIGLAVAAGQTLEVAIIP